MIHNFLRKNLEHEHVEYQRGHPISKKKTGKSRPAILRLLRFPERELGSRRGLEPEGDSDEVKSSQVNSSRRRF